MSVSAMGTPVPFFFFLVYIIFFSIQNEYSFIESPWK